MSRQDINRSGEMEVFARVVELGGFSAAARAFRMSPSAVSKLVARLEARLGVRLINRSTRKLQLTPEGTAYYDRSIRILDDINTAEREAAVGATRVVATTEPTPKNVPCANAVRTRAAISVQ